MARTAAAALKLYQPFSLSPQILTSISPTSSKSISFSTFSTPSKKRQSKKKNPTTLSTPSSSSIKATTQATPVSTSKAKAKAKAALEGEKRRTRSEKEFKQDFIDKFGIDKDSHFPVLLGEVLDVFSSSSTSPSSFRLRSFVDCTLGAAGHSSAIIQAHPELQTYIGLDVDPIAHEKAQTKIHNLLQKLQSDSTSDLKAHMVVKNFRQIKQIFGQIDKKLLCSGVDGILMDLGMSSMQVNDAGRGFSMLNNGPLDMRMDPEASLKAEDILNSWPATEVGRVLREYGEESNWYFLQNKIVKARVGGGFHSTNDLVDLIRGTTSRTKVGRQGWIKTAARVFQALRIAVNDELKTLEHLYSCFDCLSPGGRLAVISFHSLEDRIVKQTFLNIINDTQMQKEEAIDREGAEPTDVSYDPAGNEHWIKQVVKGSAGVVLTKRPITVSIEEERLNTRSRSAKLRVIQKF